MALSPITIIALCIALMLTCLACRNGKRRSGRIEMPLSVVAPTDEAEFNRMFTRATGRLESLVQTGGYSPRSPSKADAFKLKRLCRELEACLAFAPDHWQSMVFLGKACQSLGEHHAALGWFEKAMTVEAGNSIILKEASLEAIHLRDIDKALEFSGAAVGVRPDDPVLLGNHAMNLLIAGRDEEARATITEALRIAPSDDFNARISDIIDGVIERERDRPTCESLFP